MASSETCPYPNQHENQQTAIRNNVKTKKCLSLRFSENQASTQGKSGTLRCSIVAIGETWASGRSACHDPAGRSRIGSEQTVGHHPDHAKAVGFTVRVILRMLKLLQLLEVVTPWYCAQSG
jgi:1,6-anhydro-N-acetylmuramate kinase